jgi:hypothetical protein
VSGRDPAARESLVLPLLFLTVALLGGFRLLPGDGGSMRFVPPPLIGLVLAVVLMGAMVRARLLVPDALVGGARSTLASVNGGLVILTLLAATAQVLCGLSPEAGLMRVAYYFVLVVLVWNTLAAAPDRLRLLHSLFVILGAALVFKHVILSALFDDEGGMVKRMLLALMEGVSVGSVETERLHEATGYVAFGNVLLYLLGLALLPAGVRSTAMVMAHPVDAELAPTRASDAAAASGTLP